jgi:hypothetical protein
MGPARRLRAGFRKFSGGNSCIARPRRDRARLTVYPPRIQIAVVAARLALCVDEVRILIFDDPAEL